MGASAAKPRTQLPDLSDIYPNNPTPPLQTAIQLYMVLLTL